MWNYANGFVIKGQSGPNFIERIRFSVYIAMHWYIHVVVAHSTRRTFLLSYRLYLSRIEIMVNSGLFLLRSRSLSSWFSRTSVYKSYDMTKFRSATKATGSYNLSVSLTEKASERDFSLQFLNWMMKVFSVWSKMSKLGVLWAWM